jgi:hypothetical protein
MRTGRSVNSFARASGTSRSAAAPSLTGEQCSRRSGAATMEEAATSSTLITLRNCAFRLSAPCRWFFTETQCRSSSVVPRDCMWARAIMAYNPGKVMPW